MKKLLVIVGAFLFASAMVSDLWAYTYSHSTSFTRTQSRAATISSVDSVYYNPAGLVKIEDGLYLDIGNQMGTKTYESKVLLEPYTMTDTTPSFTIPNLAVAYKNDKGALFLSLYIPAGGGSVYYSNNKIGLPTVSALLGSPITLSYIKASNFWFQGRVGGAYSLTDWMALTAGLTFSYFSYEQSAGIGGLGTLMKEKQTATGISGFGGVMITPMEKLAIGVLYSAPVIARGDARDMKLHYSAITEERLPDFLLIGVNIKPVDSLEIQASYQLNFSGEKKYGSKVGVLSIQNEWAFANPIGTATGGNRQDVKHRIQHKIGLGGEFTVNKIFLLSAGVSYETQEVYPLAQNPLDPDLDNIGVGLGAKITPIENFSIDLGAAKYFYFTETILSGMLKMNKSVWSFGIGLTAKVM